MSTQTESNKLIAQRLIDEVITAGRLEVLDEIFAEDCDYEGPPPGFMRGREGYRATMSSLHRCFENAACEVDVMIAEGDRVGVCARLSGRQIAAWATMPPCGEQVSFRIMHIFQIEEGVITRYVDSRDEVSMWTQIGSVPQHLRSHLATTNGTVR